MWSETYQTWRQTITEHYGDLATFSEAATIQILFERAKAQIVEVNTFLDKMQDFHLINITPWKDEQIALYNIKQELENHPCNPPRSSTN